MRKHLSVGMIMAQVLLGSAFLLPAQAQDSQPVVSELITPDFVDDIQDFLNKPIIALSVQSQNEKRKGITNAEILELDQIWLDQVGSSGPQPLIAAALASPVSNYLLRVQAGSKGLYNEIFVVDLYGLNVGQSSITSDYWQGDEDKVLKTLPQGVGGIFVDAPEFNDEFGIWLVQVNLVLEEAGQPIGVSTVEVNLTELQRRNALGVS